MGNSEFQLIGKTTGGVIAAYNHQDFVFEAIQSLATQVDQVSIVDDCSSDSTWQEILRAKRAFNNVVAVRNTSNLGVSRSVNLAVGACNAEILLFLGSDDVAKPDRASRQIRTLSETGSLAAVCRPQIINHLSEPLDEWTAPEFMDSVEESELLFRLVFQGNFLCAPSMAIKKSTFLEIGGFKPGLEQLQDYDFWLRLAQKGSIFVDKEPHTKYRKHVGNLSGENNGKTLARDARSFFERRLILFDFFQNCTDDALIRVMGRRAHPKLKNFWSLVAPELRKYFTKRSAPRCLSETEIFEQLQAMRDGAHETGQPQENRMAFQAMIEREYLVNRKTHLGAAMISTWLKRATLRV